MKIKDNVKHSDIGVSTSIQYNTSCTSQLDYLKLWSKRVGSKSNKVKVNLSRRLLSADILSGRSAWYIIPRYQVMRVSGGILVRSFNSFLQRFFNGPNKVTLDHYNILVNKSQGKYEY